MTDTYTLCPTSRTYIRPIIGEGRDFASRAVQSESPCTVARETPWRGCVSVSLEPAVDAGVEGDGRLRESKDPRQSQSPVSHTAAYTPL